MTLQLLACSNCEQGAADRFWWLTAGAVLVSLALAVVLLARLRTGDVQARVRGGVAVAILLVGLAWSLNTLAQGTRAFAAGVTVSCGSALTAAEARGMPTDAALDPTQLACRQAGRHQLRDGLPLSLPTFAAGFLATVACIAMSRRRPVAMPVLHLANS